MPRRTRRHLATFFTATANAAGAVLLLAGPASAHVRVIAEARPGQPATLQFRVPSELADATTVRVAVAIPSDLSVTAVPLLDGWTEKTIAGSAKQVTQLIWTAKPGHEIKPDNHLSFTVRVGPLPNQRSVSFDTEQTYSNGTIATWDQRQTGSEEPPYPAPVLVINPDAPASPVRSGAPRQPTTTQPPEPGSGAIPTPSVTGTFADAAQTASSAGMLAAIGGGMVVVAAISAAVLRRRRRHNRTLRP
ncbi:DUF1775 domain-containing protein [Streptomyces sp. NPDC006923]|uniref:DUF1775 domain-containing protein n=1 Tax=Streptomyces sp. NPDC006923 TaxID=3155355 RepID=UPI0034070D92